MEPNSFTTPATFASCYYPLRILQGIAATLTAFSFAGCGTLSTWGYKTRMGDRVYPPVPYQHVQVFFGWPQRPFEQIGICSVLGGAFATDVDMYQKLQKSAALMGADGVVVTGEGHNTAMMPGYSNTTSSGYAVGAATYNPINRTAYAAAAEVGQSNTTYMPATSIALPTNKGIAIKFIEAAPESSKKQTKRQ